MVRRAKGFTLLEAVLAVVILAAAVMAALGIRAQSMIASQNMLIVQRAERDAQALFDLAIAGMLGQAESIDTELGLTTWSGEVGIELKRGYTVRRLPEVLPNPASGLDERAAAGDVAMWRYEIEVGGREVVFLWHR